MELARTVYSRDLKIAAMRAMDAPSTPATPPYMRVRIRRFGQLR